MRRLALPVTAFTAVLALILAGCNHGYSPNTYASSAAQEEATVQRGTIIGVRQVLISASGAVGAAAGGAAGGVAGAQVAGGPVAAGLGVVGGALVGGIGGTAAAQAVSNTKGWEYIVQESGDKLVSVTQTSKIPLLIGQNVLVISDAQQARIVPDYTVQIPPPAAKPATPNGTTEVYLSPLPLAADAATPLQVAPMAPSNDAPAAPAQAPAPPNSAAAPVAPPPAPAAAPMKASASATAAPAQPTPATSSNTTATNGAAATP